MKETAQGRTLGQGVLGKSFFRGEIFDQLDHFETLSRRELQERAEKAQTFDSAACRHTELEMQLSREIEVFHLAPMTSTGLRDPLKNRTPHQNQSRRSLGRGPPSSHTELHPNNGLNRSVVTMPRNNPSGKPNRGCSDASSASHHRDFRITGISTAVTHLRQEVASITHTALIAINPHNVSACFRCECTSGARIGRCFSTHT
ncbi:hypothetical protein H1B27_18290 [Bradyrhizobium sp. CNPSo 4019]|uniref:Uncharacterized protein n=1 Tax=Bradyrhizobium diversitatis TaxID=2755406 RepID=A0ABS0P4N9_9BRAD|nr:hypothetical protein [Bradyrhizobium diversitatis]